MELSFTFSNLPDQEYQLPLVVAFDFVDLCAADTLVLSNLANFKSLESENFDINTVKSASVVILKSLVFSPRSLQRVLHENHLILCVGAQDKPLELAFAEELGLRLVNVDVSRVDECADSAMGLILSILRKVVPLSSKGCAGPGWTHGHYLFQGMRRLKGLVLGLVGMDDVAEALATRAASFGMKVVYFESEKMANSDQISSKPSKSSPIAHPVTSLDELLSASDVVSLHCTLTIETEHIINFDNIGKMKQGSVLVNVSNCLLVDDTAVKYAIGQHILAGCAMDGADAPAWMESWLNEYDNVLILPKSAELSEESQKELRAKVLNVVREYLVNGTLGGEEEEEGVEEVETDERKDGEETLEEASFEREEKKEEEANEKGEGEGVASVGSLKNSSPETEKTVESLCESESSSEAYSEKSLVLAKAEFSSAMSRDPTEEREEVGEVVEVGEGVSAASVCVEKQSITEITVEEIEISEQIGSQANGKRKEEPDDVKTESRGGGESVPVEDRSRMHGEAVDQSSYSSASSSTYPPSAADVQMGGGTIEEGKGKVEEESVEGKAEGREGTNEVGKGKVEEESVEGKAEGREGIAKAGGKAEDVRKEEIFIYGSGKAEVATPQIPPVFLMRSSGTVPPKGSGGKEKGRVVKKTNGSVPGLELILPQGEASEILPRGNSESGLGSSSSSSSGSFFSSRSSPRHFTSPKMQPSTREKNGGKGSSSSSNSAASLKKTRSFGGIISGVFGRNKPQSLKMANEDAGNMGSQALEDGTVVHLRPVSGLETDILAAEKLELGDGSAVWKPILASGRPGVGEIAQRFVVVRDRSDKIGFMSFAADGNYLQAKNNSELVFSSQFYSPLEMWVPDKAKKLHVINCRFKSVSLDVTVVSPTSTALID